MTGDERLDIAWVLTSATLVLLMQAGFLCLETGFTRAKNSINVAIKNLSDFAISALLFTTFGFAVAFGPTLGGWSGAPGPYGSLGTEPAQVAFFVFQMMFCATATTIVSGAVAERMRFTGYLMVATIVSGLVYPVFVHWAWNGLGTDGPGGWLAELGFVDFAGSSVVHGIAGWAALAGVCILGPREGLATTNMNARTEGQRVAFQTLPVEVDRQGIDEARRVEPRDRSREENHLTALDLDPMKLEILAGHPPDIRRAESPQQLFDRIRNQARVVEKLLPVPRIGGEEVHLVQRGRGHRIEPAQHEHRRHARELLFPKESSIDLGPEHGLEHVGFAR